MAARLPPELAGELYCRANIEPMVYNVMTPQIATDLLDKAWGMLTQGRISFSYNYIDKPKEGSGFFLKVQPEEIMMPHDGYQYMDDEVTYNYPSDNRLSITERSQGFAHGDQYTHIVRRKYTLVQSGREPLAFLHYSKADVSRTVVVDGRRAKTPARQYPLKPIPGSGMPQPQPPPPQQQQQQQQQQVYQQGYRPQQPPKMAGPYGGSPIAGPPASPQQGNYGRFGAVPAPIAAPPGQQQPQRMQPVNPGPYGNQRHEKKSSHKKHQQQKQQLTPQQQAQVLAQQQAQAQEDAEEPSGDELDFLTARDVAIARYKRNHDYIAEVFSPYPTSRIIPPRPEYQKSVGFLKSLSEKHDDDLDVLKSEHDEKIKKFKAEAVVFYKGLEELKQATTNQEVIAANERVEVYKGMTVQSYTALRQMDLPKDEATRTPELKPSRVPKQADVPDAVMANPAANEPVAPVANIAIPGMIGAVVTNGIVAGGAQGEMAGAIAAAGAMDVDTTAINPVQQSIAPVVSEDIEMTTTVDVSNIALAPEIQAAIPTAAALTTHESSAPAIEQTVAIASDIVMEEQQPIAQVQAIQAATPVTEPTSVSITPIETPTAITASETFTTVQSTAIMEDPTTTPIIPVIIAAEQPVIAETIVQQSSTSSTGDGNHVTTTASSSFTTSLTDASGVTVTDMTKTADTAVSYSDGRQEQFPQQVVHEYHVKHTEQTPVPVAQVENTPQEATSTVTVTDIGSNATETGLGTATSAPTDIVADGETLAQLVAQPVDPASEPMAPATEAQSSESTTQLGESSTLEGAPQEQQQQNQPQNQQQQQQYHPGSFGH
ncbi:hypothetical protein BG011_009047 [Mortierella polycephala]|uniref:SWI/SNF and RSC complexes subunit Ssr4 C-terminal domain-containing protein n=1 Tax=Mortierella polycephala TaxID=41804 RepID=A0A9P6TX11_9FUNG|nr:hypothetical protein BG011_009047 [Mortierella polycephala]